MEHLERDELRLLNETRPLDFETPDWRLGAQGRNRLWIITLHYHEWIYSLAWEAKHGSEPEKAATWFRRYVTDWIDRCALEEPGSTALAWNSYAVAKRIGWWIRSHRVARDEVFAKDPRFERRFLQSLWQQAAFLADHLEWDLRANHLMEDCVGLALAGRFFAEEAADRWLDNGGRIAASETQRQVLPDGGHYERSAKYHLDVMEDILQIGLLVRDESVRDTLEQTWKRMADWISRMRHPDGGTIHFNDGEIVSGQDVERMLQSGAFLACEPSPPSGKCLQRCDATGYWVARGDVWTVFFDVGEIGPREQPGHAHADSLTLEASCGKHRLIVDPGTYRYDDDPRRRYDRSTAAHNTVCIDEENSSEVWDIFRVGRRARPLHTTVDTVGPNGIRIRAAHDGYDHLPGRPRHHRTLELPSAHVLQVCDEIMGEGLHRVDGGLLVDPAWTVRRAPDGWIATLSDEAGEDFPEVRIHVDGPKNLDLLMKPDWYHPTYGIEVEATRVGWSWEGRLPCRVTVKLETGKLQ